MLPDFDIAICGAGPVGLALSAMLVQRGMAPERVVLIDAKPVEQAVKDPRSIALSWGSKQLLDGIGAWPDAADAIHDIHVSRRGHFGRALISRAEYGVPALGYVTRYGTLVAALAQAVGALRIPAFRPAQVAGMTERADTVELQLADGRILTSAIAVQAEGGLFSEQQAKSVQRDYDQTAIVSHVLVSRPIAYRAFERFTDEGPLALLPQGDPQANANGSANGNGYALVWCARPPTAQRLLALSDAEFLRELQNAFGDRLGRFTQAAQRVSYSLGLNARPATSPRTIAIGNAAQTLHPVAGQGLNLGLRDAAVLARMLAHEATPGCLLEFSAARRTDRSLTITLTDTMARIFASTPDGAPMQAALGISLGLIDAIKPAKRLLAEQMMFGMR
jgi:2-octaprenyl-6-methoxyphenol hydroxylase